MPKSKRHLKRRTKRTFKGKNFDKENARFMKKLRESMPFVHLPEELVRKEAERAGLKIKQ